MEDTSAWVSSRPRWTCCRCGAQQRAEYAEIGKVPTGWRRLNGHLGIVLCPDHEKPAPQAELAHGDGWRDQLAKREKHPG